MRWIVAQTYLASLGQVSEILDTQSNRRILVAGSDHRTRAERRAAELNAETARGPAAPARSCCPPTRRP